MILKYGSYAHEQNEARIVIQREALRSETGLYYGYRETWSITGFLQADDQAALTIALAALEVAYSSDGGDLVFYLDDGTTPTQHKILNADTMGGVTVVNPPSFPEGRGAEYSTFRYYSITVAAEIPLTTDNVILSWSEELDFQGNGAGEQVYLPTLIGQWVHQQTTQFSTYTATQSGQAVGLYTWPTPASPIWPAAEHQTRRRVRLRTPRFRNGVGWEFPASWSYFFESNAVLTGNPTPV